MNQRESKIIKQIKNNITVLTTVIFLFLVITPLFSNKTIEKEIKESKLKALEQEGENYRLVTSADNVQVPVPKGYVASSVTEENYVTPEYQHTLIPYKGNYTQLTWSSPEGEQYPWTQDENGIWISGNQGIPNSTSTIESEEFDYIKGTTVTINYTYSCQSTSGSDYLTIYIIDVINNIPQIIISKGGNASSSFDYTTSNYTYTMNNWGTGRYKIRAIYRKNGGVDDGQDSGYIKTSTYFKENENGTIIQVNQKTKIHDGGFVIYQLTDEEIEEDPNGTNVNINDTNKDEAKSERNQYVWVPVQYINDIVRTKIANNGIMQFGQKYNFSNTVITKDNDYREPKLSRDVDKTKYYLQKYSKLYIRENYLKNMQEDYARMIKSITKYKGFYIGRYETGDDDSHSSSKKCFTSPRVVRYNSNIGNVTWYDSYKDLQRLSGKTEEYVKTGMTYDSLWDYTLKWLKDTDTRSYEDISSDSGTWGNYRNNSFKYKESANGTEITKVSNTTPTTPTGGITEITYNGEINNNSPTASNNIFDIAGNVYEWTMSHNSSNYRINRGGDCSDISRDYPARYSSRNYPYSCDNTIGVRAQLYIL